MASRNYYVVLGVASTESNDGIRAAYRDLAKQLHPDHVGPSGAPSFRELTEAYDVLRDPERRHAYDQALRRREQQAADRRISMRRDLAEARPSEDALFDRVARNFTGVGVSKGERVEELTVDLAISKEEADRGARVQVGVPVFARCVGCRGMGCSACAGQGVRESERPVTIEVPSMSGAGTTFVMPLSGLGIHNFWLRVRVRVDKRTEPPPQPATTSTSSSQLGEDRRG